MFHPLHVRKWDDNWSDESLRNHVKRRATGRTRIVHKCDLIPPIDL